MKKFKLYTHNDWVNYAWESVNDSEYMQWDVRRCYYGDPHPYPDKTERVFYTDSELSHALKHECAQKVALMLESRFVTPHFYEYLENNIDTFDIVLTHDESLIAKYPDKCVFYPHNNCLIKRSDFKVYEKTKLLSFISSVKQMNISGHMMRHAIYSLYTSRSQNWVRTLAAHVQMDLYGGLANNYVPYKLDSLKDYCFQVVVENSIIDTYFTEKIIDCFVTGTIPIYYGTRKVNDYFDANGIIHFSTLEELFKIIGQLSEQDYENRANAINKNFEIAQNHILPEDWIFKNTRVFN